MLRKISRITKIIMVTMVLAIISSVFYRYFNPIAKPIVFTANEQQYIVRNPVVNYAAEKDYMPFIFLSPHGPIDGISKDYLNLISRKTGIRFIPAIICSLPGCLSAVREGSAAMLTSLRAPEERSQYLTFTRPYIVTGSLLVTRKVFPGVIGVSRGYSIIPYIIEHFPESSIHESSNDGESARKLLHNDIDSMIVDERSFEKLKENYDFTNYSVKQLDFEYYMSFAFNNKSADGEILRNIMDKAIENITVEESEGIKRKWK